MLADAVWIVVDATGSAVRRFTGDLTAALLYASERHGNLLGPFSPGRAAAVMESLAKRVYGARGQQDPIADVPQSPAAVPETPQAGSRNP